MKLPLEGLVVLEFSQYLSGPSAGLRLADLGARVIKIERPGKGDAGRKLAIENLWVDDSSLLFHTINRNKESFTANLKNADELVLVKKLIAKVDILTHNFRPGIMERVGLGYDAVKEVNPSLIYAEISGYGKSGPWRNLPGQDLLLQSLSGLSFTTGNYHQNPVPFGISIGDYLCGAQLVQGILAALIRRTKTGEGAFVELSLLETLLDFQFELFTTYFASGQVPQRSKISNANPLLGAPYGIYTTADGYIALAMMDLQVLANTIHCEPLKKYSQEDAFQQRDTIKKIIADHLFTQKTGYWLQLLQAKDLWAMDVLNWQQLMQHEGYKVLQMEQKVNLGVGKESLITPRCPIRINGERLFSDKPAPQLGEHNEIVMEDFLN